MTDANTLLAFAADLTESDPAFMAHGVRRARSLNSEVATQTGIRWLIECAIAKVKSP
jgi:hypothetical protein